MSNQSSTPIDEDIDPRTHLLIALGYIDNGEHGDYIRRHTSLNSVPPAHLELFMRSNRNLARYGEETSPSPSAQLSMSSRGHPHPQQQQQQQPLAGAPMGFANQPEDEETVDEMEERMRRTMMIPFIMYSGVNEHNKQLLRHRMGQSDLEMMEVDDIANSFNSVTHIIASINNRRRCERTSEYLCGLLQGKWIIDETWITDSCDRGYWLPEEPYIVHGDTDSEHIGAPMRAHRALVEGRALPFNGLYFYLHGSFRGHIQMRDITLLCEMGGGTVVDHPHVERCVAIISNGNEHIATIRDLNPYAQIRTVEWLIDTISRGIGRGPP